LDKALLLVVLFIERIKREEVSQQF